MSRELLERPRIKKRKPAASPTAVTDDPSFTEKFLNRTSRLLSAQALARLRESRLLIAGCGGVGGAVALTMARLGVEHFVLADPGEFDEPDINRQWAADTSTLGDNKADVYADLLKRINPHVKIDLHPEGITEKNVQALMDTADLVIDCLDISVDMELRARLYKCAEERGLHGIMAPVLGFGAFIAIASPDGMSMDPILEHLGTSSSASSFPDSFRDFYPAACLQAIDRDMKSGHLPSISIGPVLASAFVSTEALLILLKGHLRPWRKPVCLPQILMVDAFMANFKIATIEDLLPKGAPSAASGEPIPKKAKGVSSNSSEQSEVSERNKLLRGASFNTNLLPPASIEVDLRTDSWGEITDSSPEPQTDSSDANVDCENRFRELYGYHNVLSVSRGRFAEALLATAVIKPNTIVASNALFPSTRFHIGSRGAALQDIGLVASDEIGWQSSDPLSADLDLGKLDALTEGREQQPVSCVWIEACSNALGGAPLSLDNLKAVYQRCSAVGIPVILDGTRLLDNVHAIRNFDADTQNLDRQSLLYEYTRHSDACALSAMKDFRVKCGGFVATHSEALFYRLRDLTLAFGSGIGDLEKKALGRGMAGDPFSSTLERVQLAEAIYNKLQSLHVPGLLPASSHGIFIDAAALLPHIPLDQFPVQALANELYVRFGIRGGDHFYSPAQQEKERAILRLAIPISRFHPDSDLASIVARAFEEISKNPSAISGLKKTFQPEGVLGGFIARYATLGDSSD